MFASFQKKYFLSDKGVAGVKRGIFWTTLTNLITMAGMGLLFLVMAGFVIAFIVASPSARTTATAPTTATRIP